MKILLTISILLFAISCGFAQDTFEITDLYQKVRTAKVDLTRKAIDENRDVL